METVHVHAGGIVGGFSICEERGGTLANDADKANCKVCIQKLIDYCKIHPNYRYEDEIRRAAANVNLPF